MLAFDRADTSFVYCLNAFSPSPLTSTWNDSAHPLSMAHCCIIVSLDPLRVNSAILLVFQTKAARVYYKLHHTVHLQVRS